MNCNHDLPRLIGLLARLDAAGWLGDLECAAARATSGPRNDLERYPTYGFEVEKYARKLSMLLDLPIGICRDAACEALLPSTRRATRLEILEEFEELLDQAEKAERNRQQASTILASERRRRA